MKKHLLNNEVIFEYNLKNLIDDDIFNFIYEMRDKNLGQYDGLVSSTQRQTKSVNVSKKYKKSNFNGFQSFEHPYITEKTHMNKWFFNLFSEVDKIVNSGFDSRFEYKLNNYWFNINKKGSYNKLHNHINTGDLSSGLSGVFYLKTPKNCGNIIFETDSKNKLEIESKEGKLLIFPIYLLHSVQESKSNDDRISVAFNYTGFVKNNKKVLV